MKKKGFTLIELLAVIVILAIIALIATPLILKYIDKSNREALRNSIYSIDRSIVMKGTLDRKDKEYTSTDELDVKIKDTDIKISYVDGETRYYKVSNENYLLDVKKCEAKKYCTIEEIESIKNVIIHKSELFPNVVDNNPGIICGDGETEDTTLTTCHIRSIEDLVSLSTLVNKGTTFKDKTIELVNSLDFNNSNSYASGKVDDRLISGEGFTPIGGSKGFQGTFDGNDNIIKGLYINRPQTSRIGLFSYINYGIIKNISIDKANITGYGNVGSLIGYNYCGSVDNIVVNNIEMVANYMEVGGLIGYNNEGIVSNISLDNIEISNQSQDTGSLIGLSKYGMVENINVSNVKIEAGYSPGGLIGYNYSNIKDAKLKNIDITSTLEYTGGLVGTNRAELIENIILENISVTNSTRGVAGLIGINADNSNVNRIIGNNIKLRGGRYATSGLISKNGVNLISNIKLTNLDVEGDLEVSFVTGTNNGKIYNVKVQGTLKGNSAIGGISGMCSYPCTISNVVVKGDIEGTNGQIGGLVGYIKGTSETELANISGVYIGGSIIDTKNTAHRILGTYQKYPTLNTLASSLITVNGNTVESTDPTSLNGKSLDNMGKVSQSEYEALGFEFESTDTNEAYWYFNEDDELDLIIK